MSVVFRPSLQDGAGVLAGCSPDSVRGYSHGFPPGSHRQSRLLKGNAGLSGDMALRVEKAFGVRMDTLMRVASAYEIAATRRREELIRGRRVVCAG
jgi:hypothetical protein